MKRKAIAAILAASMMLSLTACSGSVYKTTVSKATKFIKSDLKAEEADEDIIKYFTKNEVDDNIDEFEDGYYFELTDEKDIKKSLDDIAYTDDVKAKDIEKVFVYIIGDSDTNRCMFIVYDFVDADAAEDYFDSMTDEFEEEYDDMEYFSDMGDIEFTDDDDNVTMLAAEVEFWGDQINMYGYATYEKDMVVLAIVASDSKKSDTVSNYNDLMEAMGYENPKDTL